MKKNNNYPSGFGVTAKHFSLYKAFKEEAEKLGWTYNYDFTPFTEAKFESLLEDESDRQCLYFSYEFGNCEGKPAFAFSNSNLAICLERNFQIALDHLKACTVKPKPNTIWACSNGIDLEIDWDDQTVSPKPNWYTQDVVDATFTFSQIQSLAEFIKHSGK
jgi:hypothetical protein